jgi:hypothetical protein
MLCRWHLFRSSLIAHRRSISSESLMRSVRGVLDGSGDSGHIESLRSLLVDAGDASSSTGRRRRAPPPSALPSEVSATLRQAYDAHRADPAARLRFFRLLSEGFGLRAGGDDDAVAAAYEAFRRQREAAAAAGGGGGGGHDAAALARAAARLRDAATPPYMRLLLPVAQQNGGIDWLVQLRGDLLELLRRLDDDGSTATNAAAPALRALADDLRGALSSWFSPGLLRLRALDWATTPAALLDRAARADRVHPMSSLEELRARLDRRDRRVFAFEHPSTPGDPLVVLHTALFPAVGLGAGGGDVDADAAVPSRIDQILGPQATPATTTTTAASPAVACFYSVSSDNPGLAGVDLGNFLIKKAAAALTAEFPSIRRLATLSPMPLMRATLEQRLVQLSRPVEAEAETEAPALAALRRLLSSGDVPARLEQARRALKLERPAGAVGPAAELSALLGNDDNPWLSRSGEHGDLQLFDEVLLPRLAAIYLTLEKRRGRALDPVANFHLTNGAVVWRVCASADRSSRRALASSLGCMVNYAYDLDRVHERNRKYVVEREVAVGRRVQGLLQ